MTQIYTCETAFWPKVFFLCFFLSLSLSLGNRSLNVFRSIIDAVAAVMSLCFSLAEVNYSSQRSRPLRCKEIQWTLKTLMSRCVCVCVCVAATHLFKSVCCFRPLLKKKQFPGKNRAVIASSWLHPMASTISRQELSSFCLSHFRTVSCRRHSRYGISCVKKKRRKKNKESLREKFKPCLLSHLCTPGQSLRKVGLIVRCNPTLLPHLLHRFWDISMK